MAVAHQVTLTTILGILWEILLISAFPNDSMDSQRTFNNSLMSETGGEEWDTWKAPASILSAFVYYRSGYDEDGLVVYVLESGRANYKDLALGPQEYINDFWKFYDQLYQRVEYDAARNNNQSIVLLMDWDGFSLQNYASAEALQMTLKMFTSLVRMNNAVRYGYNINVNFVAQEFINVGKPFLGNMLDKFEFYGTRKEIWRPMLLRKIPADQLAPQYGGDKNWKPLSREVTMNST